ncbi:GDSL esterase/lipase EXL3-like [Phragmites australis]|uniref:GDSL esterase/lipase EXL3-like n=1 Tax=Phragmites australis TaxID=29695 RepID=UPI002D76D29A|nr:GDSL esterase/lipase EXL3-like [Phragmites australis]
MASQRTVSRSLVVLMAAVVLLHRSRRVAAAAALSSSTTTNQARAPALFVLGDSIVDSGNNNAITTMVRCNFAPYGQDFPGHNATGRFSNGKVPGDILASRMGIKEYVPAYLGTQLSDFDLLTGVSFASGGCGFDPLTAELVSALTMDNQLDLFKEYKEKLNRVAGAQRAADIVSTSLYLVVTGTDDLANTYFTTPFRRDYDLESYIEFVVQCASDFTKKLYGLGARRVNIAGAPPIGCVPSQRTNAGGLERECVALYNQAAVVFNAALEKEIKRLNGSAELPGSVLKYIDLYTPLLDMIQRPDTYGFEVTNRGCCGTGVFEVTLTCNRYTAHPCKDPTKFLFWDTYHLTERGYNLLLSQIINRYGF